jgi:hypothetical protein
MLNTYTAAKKNAKNFRDLRSSSLCLKNEKIFEIWDPLVYVSKKRKNFENIILNTVKLTAGR